MTYRIYFAENSQDAWKQFVKEYGRKPKHCFKNTWGKGYIIFDTKEEVNAWYRQHTGRDFYTDVPVAGQAFTKEDAINEIKSIYEECIDDSIATRDFTMPILVIGLPNDNAFGNRMVIKFVPEYDERYLEWRFDVHYSPRVFKVESVSNLRIKEIIIELLYRYFYDSRFKKRIESNC